MNIYTEAVIRHSRRNSNLVGGEDLSDYVSTRLNNSTCGDSVSLYVLFEGGRVSDCKFHGDGCAISLAAASMLSSTVVGMTIGEIGALRESFYSAMLNGPGGSFCDLGKLNYILPVAQNRQRVKCAMLAVDALGLIVKSVKEN